MTFTEEHKRRLSESHKGKSTWNSGKKGYTNSGSFKKGHKGIITNHTKETRDIISKSKLGKKRPDISGEKNNNWKGGITSKNGKIRHSISWRIWRSEVFSRDAYTCQLCGKTGIELHPHHIIKVSECIRTNREELIFDINNGVTYCKECHMKLHGLWRGD